MAMTAILYSGFHNLEFCVLP